MSKTISVSERTIFRRMSEYNLKTSAFAEISDVDLTSTPLLQVCYIDFYCLLLEHHFQQLSADNNSHKKYISPLVS